MSKDKEETHEYLLDVKLWTSVRVRASSSRRARQIVKEFTDCLDIGLHADARNHDFLEGEEEIRLTEASAEGELDLVEIDGEAC